MLYLTNYLNSKMDQLDGLDIAATSYTKMMRYYYDHEILGMEKIPSSGAALLVWYHGVNPVDYVALVARLYLRDRRMVNSVVHKALPLIPGWKRLEETVKLTAGSREEYARLLKSGEMVGVAVGGAEEALFDWEYNTLWGKRNGFAKLALETGVPIIPIFTENIREAFDTFSIGGDLLKVLYDKTRMVGIWPVYGGFPVKLTTHVGDPITPREDETADQLKERVEKSMKDLIDSYQIKEGGVRRAVIERLTSQFSLASLIGNQK